MRWIIEIPAVVKKLALIVGAFVLLIVLSYGLYEPYRVAYSQGYTWVDFVDGFANADLVVSDALGRVPIPDHDVAGMGDASMDGRDAGLGAE